MKKDFNEIVCGYCNRKSASRGGCYQRKCEDANTKAWSRPDNSGQERELDGNDRAMINTFSKSVTKPDKAMSARPTTYIDSGATMPMVMDAVVSVSWNPSSYSIVTASGEVDKAKSKGASELRLSKVTAAVKLDACFLSRRSLRICFPSLLCAMAGTLDSSLRTFVSSK